MRHAPLAASLLLTVLAACSSQSPGPSSASPAGVTSGSLSAASASTPALDVLKRGGSFAFALDESKPSEQFREECRAESGGDTAKADACYAHIRDVGSHEGFRFAFDASDHLVWTSYGREDGKEVIYIEAPLAVATDGDHVVVGTPVGTPKGVQLEGKPFPAGTAIRFEVVDERTIATDDPHKGRLVYHRAP